MSQGFAQGAVEDGEELTEPERQPEREVDATPSQGGLAGRMAERADYLEKHQSEWFGIPGFEDILQVNLRALSYVASAKIRERNQKIMDQPTRELYVLADTIVTATEGFREVVAQDEYRDLGDDWVSLARRMPNPPDELTPRRAVLFLVSDKRLPFLVNEWGEWAKVVRKDVDEEVVRDFSTTG